MDASTIAATSSNAATASAATDAGVKLAANFDTFLKLLTTQLQYQDPLSPMDSNQFTQQLVQFSGVEQAIASNKNLEKLVNFQLSNATSTAASYIGKQVTAGGDTAQLTGGSARWSYTLGANAADTQIEISDLAGHVVYKTSGQTTMGEHIFAWDGRASDNSIVPDGTYKISIASADASGNNVTTTTNIQGIVAAVDIQSGEPMLNIGGISLKLSDIIRIAAPPASLSSG